MKQLKYNAHMIPDKEILVLTCRLHRNAGVAVGAMQDNENYYGGMQIP